jgi:dienelactone hydrolase
MRVVTRRRLALLVLLASLTGLGWLAWPYAEGASFVVRAAEMQGAARVAADFITEPATERDFVMPVGGGLGARAYEPTGGFRRTALLTSGLHPSGIDEPRLVALARQLSASGIAVVTPDIPDLSRFAVTPAITDAIEQAAGWLAAEPRYAPDGTIGLMGISFSGGLSIVAAGRPSLRGRIAYVFAFGGHGDLPRVLRYLCTGEEVAPGTRTLDARIAIEVRKPPPPHDYGLAVLLYGLAERVVPSAQVGPLKAAVHRFLLASALDRTDKPGAAREFAALRALAPTLPRPAATLLAYVNDRDVVHLGARLLPFIDAYGGDAPALSAERAPKPDAPVFLLHGLADNVIPADESVHLADDLRGHARVRVLLSALISHAETDRPAGASDVLQLAGFWGDLLTR